MCKHGDLGAQGSLVVGEKPVTKGVPVLSLTFVSVELEPVIKSQVLTFIALALRVCTVDGTAQHE